MGRLNLIERRIEHFMRQPPSVRNAAGVIVVATAVVTVGAGALISSIDRDEYPNVGVGLWWAIQTVTTVGYGDVAPKDVVGRVVAAIVMLYGIAFIAIVTAGITSTFVARATRVPTPRFDLLKMRHYMFGSVQFSRGCPYQCEFCDIIVTFGRRPRLKTSVQIIAEIEALRAQNISFAFVVDDNLIGNKKAIKVLLRDLVAWQQEQGYPMSFFTEASLDLAESAASRDPSLIEAHYHAAKCAALLGRGGRMAAHGLK